MYALSGRSVNAIPAFTLLFTLLTLLSATTQADELILRDGSRVLGEVVKRSNGTLEFKTKFAGTIKVKWAEVAELKTDQPMEFLLSDDSTVKVTRVTNNIDDMIVEGEAASGLPPQTLGQDVVAVINPEPWRKGEGRKFSGLVNFAFERERGNTDQDEIDWDGALTLRGKNDRFRGHGEYEKDVNDNTTTTKKWKLEGSYNYFFTPKWYSGAFTRFEHDKFADLDLRTSVGPLIGYQWFEGEEMNLSTSTGISYVDEDFINADDDDYAALPWSIDFDMFLFDEFVQVYHKQVGFWNLEDTSDVVWDTWTGLRFPLAFGLVASTELKVEYDSGAVDNTDDTDTTYTLKLGYKW
jgi:putative salt-induced outer membrane protein YdiY